MSVHMPGLSVTNDGVRMPGLSVTNDGVYMPGLSVTNDGVYTPEIIQDTGDSSESPIKIIFGTGLIGYGLTYIYPTYTKEIIGTSLILCGIILIRQ